jgi:hypothetical protein
VGQVKAVLAEEGVLVEGWRDMAVAPPLFHVAGDRFTTTSEEITEPKVERA